MGMTITEKIIAAHADAEHVKPGDLLEVRVDMALANDITAPLAIRVLEDFMSAEKDVYVCWLKRGIGFCNRPGRFYCSRIAIIAIRGDIIFGCLSSVNY